MYYPSGISGPKGEQGSSGSKGEKGETVESQKSAFTAVKTSVQTGSGPGIIVTFQEMVLNLGNDFDLATNKFTCRTAGTYVFDFTIPIKARGSSIIDLVKNGNSVIGGFERDNKGALRAGLVMNLAIGDQVWLEFKNTVDTHIRDKTAHFFGYLLYES